MVAAVDVSVVVPAMNERKTIARVVREALRLGPTVEVIAVVNGSTDGTEAVARRCGARVVSIPEPLGHDVGRAVGARYARGRTLLFVDADFAGSANRLVQFVRAVEEGTDVALNRYSGAACKPSHRVHRVAVAKYALNALIGRPDLRGASMTAVPHALSRRALEAIGPERLAVPPLAQAVAIASGLNVRAVCRVNVSRLNAWRPHHRRGDPVGRLILGDHLEAVDWLVRSEWDGFGSEPTSAASSANGPTMAHGFSAGGGTPP